MRKIIFTLAAVCVGLAPLCAAQLENLTANNLNFPALSAAALKQLPAPSAAAPSQGFTPDPVLNALSDAQWEELFSRPTYEETLSAESQNKELYSDFHIRYIIKGQVSFATNPPVMTSDNGRTFKVVKYPKWLKSVENTRVCVEAYLRQRENTSEIRIKKMLPPDSLDGLMPSDNIQDLMRDPYLIAKGADGYVLANVNWSLKRNTAGALEKDAYGNFISQYQNGVKINPALLEEAYYTKKNTTKPVKWGDHGLLIFKFKPGGVTAPDGSSTKFLVVSLDAYYKEQSNMTSYSPLEALKGKYLVYYSVQTAERYSATKLTDAPQSLTLYPLKLTQAQNVKLLDTALAKATDINKGEVYNLFYNSCANAALSIVNSVLEENRKIKSGWLPEIVYRVRMTFPDAITTTLMRKGVAGAPLPDITEANYPEAYK